MSILYKCDAKRFRAIARASSTVIPFDISPFYTAEEATRLERQNTDWFIDAGWETGINTSFEALFIPYCAWCYELRNKLSDSNEHDECDARLHYCSEIGKAEQAELLATEIVPKAPTSVISLIMSYL